MIPNNVLTPLAATLLAQTDQAIAPSTLKSLEFDLPDSAGDWALLAGIGIAIVTAIWLYIRDTRMLPRGWTIFLTMLRVAVLASLIVIALNPQERTQRQAYRPSQVVLLVDTSTSMQQPARDPRSRDTAEPLSRIDAVREVLADSELIEQLREQHTIDVYTFDSDLSESRHHFVTRYVPEGQPIAPTTEPEDEPAIDWDAILETRGLSTRMGDSVDKLLAEVKGRTLAGVVVFSDGVSNAGRDVGPANDRARKNSIRLFSVGVGSTEPPLNLQLAKLIAPTDVQKGDPFELTALVRGEGLEGQTVRVSLQKRHSEESEAVVVETKEATLLEDGIPVEVTFEQTGDEAGEFEYTVEAALASDTTESRPDDNVAARSVNVFDRPLRILVIAGGPMRDYRFSKNTLHRHRSMEVDVWLQTGTVGISQDADDLLFDFPETREELFGYDVVMAFDPDWSRIPEEGQQWLEEWVANEGGGMILVAGDVYTPQLAAAGDDFTSILKLYPVVLDEVAMNLDSQDRAIEAWKLGLTQEGRAAAFLQVTDDPSTAMTVWEEFPGVYRCYPTRGRKGGTTVYAEFTNPLARGGDGQPVLLAAQRYSQGQTVYLGSPEMWRLRALDEEFYDRFWIKMVRKAAEGRTKRGLQRGMLILQGADYDVGQTVPLRARVLNSQYRPLEQQTLGIDVYDPTGKPMVPPLTLRQDRNRPAEFVGDFRVALPGRYRLELSIPDSSETVVNEINVSLPKLEAASMQQDVQRLKALVAETGGRYLSIDEAAAELPALLPNMGQEFVIDQRLRELWDRQWVMFLLVGLLSVEWLTRKLLKLA
ncbi:hypothetical protein [Maioricimonas sp. JC845]|uniref:hypothetical protein n=1 Tax=Maioricimonas sp. JC845 TaxID=3232138 RepID=UPI00345A30C1